MTQHRIAALLQMLRQFGWVDGKIIVIETRFAGDNQNRYRRSPAN
jgi:hypothetical protein